MKRSLAHQLLADAQDQGGWVRPKDLRAIPRSVFRQMARDGQLRERARGLYRLADAPASPLEDFVAVSLRQPRAILCLLSALHFHGLTTQVPQAVWIALPAGIKPPRIKSPRLEVVRCTEPSYSEGVQTLRLGGRTVKVYSPAKTVADCFKFRSRIGTDLAVEALKDAWEQRKVTADELWRYAKVARVLNVMRPYLESIIA